MTAWRAAGRLVAANYTRIDLDRPEPPNVQIRPSEAHGNNFGCIQRQVADFIEKMVETSAISKRRCRASAPLKAPFSATNSFDSNQGQQGARPVHLDHRAVFSKRLHRGSLAPALLAVPVRRAAELWSRSCAT